MLCTSGEMRDAVNLLNTVCSGSYLSWKNIKLYQSQTSVLFWLSYLMKGRQILVDFSHVVGGE